MNGIPTLVEAHLRGASRLWKWLRFAQHSATILTLLGLALLGLGGGILRGWIQDTRLALGLAALGFLAGGGLLIVLAIIVAVVPRKRAWLAAVVERSHGLLLDRLSALVFLEGLKRDRTLDSYFHRIGRQAESELRADPARAPFSPRPALVRWALCLAVFTGVVSFWVKTRPWTLLHLPSAAPPAEVASPMPLPTPVSDSVDIKRPWGEVRITEPGRDMKVTKVDVVPLQIEAAANRPLQKALWFTTSSGKNLSHPLPPPVESQYAVYKPLLYVDEFSLSDWDVMTYYASAGTKDGRSYSSEMYFLEVRPFREDILKLPGGEGGRAYQYLSELSALIDAQKHVMRETHGYLQRASDAPKDVRLQDQRKLARAEADLSTAAHHTYAKIAAELEEHDVGEVLDHLSQAEVLLNRASNAIKDDAPGIVPLEQKALEQLVATRKRLQKAISDNPGGFSDSSDDTEPTPVVDLPDKLKQISEFRNEEQAGLDFTQKTLDEQRHLADRAALNDKALDEKIAPDEQKLRKQLQEFRAAHPRIFKGDEKEAVEAERAMETAEKSLSSAPDEAPADTREAASKIKQLRDSLAGKARGNQLTHAYRLRDLLDQEIRTLKELEQGKFSEETAKQAAASAGNTVQTLRSLIEGGGLDGLLGPGLRESLNDERMQALQSKLDALARAQDSETRKRSATASREALQEVARSFDASAPTAVREARGADTLKGSEEEALEQGLQQLRGLVKEGEEGRPLSEEDKQRQLREALANVRKGAEQLRRSDKQARTLLRLERVLGDFKVDATHLKKLMEEIERFRAELTDASERTSLGAMEHVDPARLPAAYRERIQKYFKKLSEP